MTNPSAEKGARRSTHDPRPLPAKAHLAEVQARFWDKVDRGAEDRCWEWQGYKGQNGYGQVGIDRRLYLTHRVAYELWNGIGSLGGLLACHTCDNPSCCNPRHLFAGTTRDNAHDCIAKGRAYKARGLDSSNGRLTDEQVRVIRERAAGEETQGAIAKDFGITAQYVGQLAAGKWRAA